MSKSKISTIFKSVQKGAKKHMPEILIALGILGMGSATVMAVKATPKALSILDDEIARKNEWSGNHPDIKYLTKEFKPKEVVALTWKCYIPAVVTGTISIACIVGASSVNTRRNAALATAYAISETAFSDYRDKVIDIVGEKKEQTIRDAVAEKHIKRNPIKDSEVTITEKGDTLCYDVISGRYFKSDIEFLKRTEIQLNRWLDKYMYVALNEFYYEIGLSQVKIGDDIGWNAKDGDIELHYTSKLAEDDTPCLVIDYHIVPRYDFRT